MSIAVTDVETGFVTAQSAEETPLIQSETEADCANTANVISPPTLVIFMNHALVSNRKDRQAIRQLWYLSYSALVFSVLWV